MTFSLLPLFDTPAIRLSLYQVAALLSTNATGSVKKCLDEHVARGELRLWCDGVWALPAKKEDPIDVIHVLVSLMNHSSLTLDGWEAKAGPDRKRSHCTVDFEEKAIYLNKSLVAKNSSPDLVRAVLCLAVVRAIQGKDEHKLMQRATELGAKLGDVKAMLGKVVIKRQRDRKIKKSDK